MGLWLPDGIRSQRLERKSSFKGLFLSKRHSYNCCWLIKGRYRPFFVHECFT
jgi:hypothetical protein